MFDAIRNRRENLGKRCLNCQKKLVADEKWVCKECRNQLMAAAAATSLLSLIIFLVKQTTSDNEKEED